MLFSGGEYILDCSKWYDKLMLSTFKEFISILLILLSSWETLYKWWQEHPDCVGDKISIETEIKFYHYFVLVFAMLCLNNKSAPWLSADTLTCHWIKDRINKEIFYAWHHKGSCLCLKFWVIICVQYFRLALACDQI